MAVPAGARKQRKVKGSATGGAAGRLRLKADGDGHDLCRKEAGNAVLIIKLRTK